MSGDAAMLIGLWVVAYLIGAVPVSYVMGRVLGGIDLRQHGSGNVGARAISPARWEKSGGCQIAAIDMARGAGPILVGQYALGLSHTGMVADADAAVHDPGQQLVAVPALHRRPAAWAPGPGVSLGYRRRFFALGLALYVLGWRITRRSAEWALGGHDRAAGHGDCLAGTVAPGREGASRWRCSRRPERS